MTILTTTPLYVLLQSINNKEPKSHRVKYILILFLYVAFVNCCQFDWMSCWHTIYITEQRCKYVCLSTEEDPMNDENKSGTLCVI